MSRVTRALAKEPGNGLTQNKEALATLVSGVNPDGTSFSFPVSSVSAIPVGTDIIAGKLSTVATTAATTVITIPAGRTWQGSLGASVSVANNAATLTAGQASATFSLAGTGVLPAAGNYFSINALVGAALGTSTIGESSNNFGSIPLTVTAPVGNSVTIQVATINTGTTSLVDAFATGVLL